jgi:hypothetical protein
MNKPRFFVLIFGILLTILLSTCAFVPETYQTVTIDLSDLVARSGEEKLVGAIRIFRPWLESERNKYSYYAENYNYEGDDVGSFVRLSNNYRLYNKLNTDLEINRPTPYFPQSEFIPFSISSEAPRLEVFGLPELSRIRLVMHVYSFDDLDPAPPNASIKYSPTAYRQLPPGSGYYLLIDTYVSNTFSLQSGRATIIDFRSVDPKRYTITYPSN